MSIYVLSPCQKIFFNFLIILYWCDWSLDDTNATLMLPFQNNLIRLEYVCVLETNIVFFSLQKLSGLVQFVKYILKKLVYFQRWNEFMSLIWDLLTLSWMRRFFYHMGVMLHNLELLFKIVKLSSRNFMKLKCWVCRDKQMRLFII